MVGATPLLSAAFHDEPSIETLNLLQMDVTSVGNHEFDEGVDELLRLQNGGCHPTDGCQDGDPFYGADFPYLAANTVYNDTGEPILPAWTTRVVQGVRVGFVGMTLQGTPQIVNPAGITEVSFLDEVETANKYADELLDRGVEAIVLLIHEGGAQARAARRRSTPRAAPTSPVRWPTSSLASTPSSTSWSPGTRTGPTSAPARLGGPADPDHQCRHQRPAGHRHHRHPEQGLRRLHQPQRAQRDRRERREEPGRHLRPRRPGRSCGTRRWSTRRPRR